MILFKKAGDLGYYISRLKGSSTTLGFVPTMGALHQGHLSLIETSRNNNSHTACSIFVNPTQFNDKRDFKNYPVTLEKDIEMLEKSGTDFLFLPDVEEIYPPGISSSHFELGYLDTILEGSSRPGHFQGVCQVLQRLTGIVKPDNMYMGLKDYQQCMVVKKMLDITGSPVKLVTSPTLREPDGLAMSSRNLRLSADARKNATAIYKALLYLKSNLAKGDLQVFRTEAAGILEAHTFRVDYIEFADADTLEIIKSWNGNNTVVALVAAFIDEVRLIDNMIISG